MSKLDVDQMIEAGAVQVGDPAPDFTLPPLTSAGPVGPNAGEEVTLSTHFGDRPVALIFGSYT
jgi:hypothetical protein